MRLLMRTPALLTVHLLACCHGVWLSTDSHRALFAEVRSGQLTSCARVKQQCM